MILSFAFSLRLSCVTSSVTFAPAGIEAPFEPVTVLATEAVKVCPTVKLFVQTRELERRLSEVPDSIVPTAPPPLAAAEPAGLRVSVLPEAVVLVVGVGGVVVRGVVRGVVVSAWSGAESWRCAPARGLASPPRPESPVRREAGAARRSPGQRAPDPG